MPFIYNQAIDEAENDPAILIFIHDDVHLCDFYWQTHLLNALQVFEVIGLAGNKRRVERQPAWNLIDDKRTWDTAENLSGIVGHGKGYPFDPQNFNVFGPPGQQVKLLDGLMLISDSKTLITKGLRFDERFDFHFYDMDFCRQAETKNIKMGTWPISVIHESYGSFGSASWRSGYIRYLSKWQG